MDQCPDQGESKNLIRLTRLTRQKPEMSTGSVGHQACKELSYSIRGFLKSSCVFFFFQKLFRGKEILEKAELSERDKERIHSILTFEDTLHYMSSEESDNDAEHDCSGPKPRCSIPLSWESSRLRNIKTQLDRVYNTSWTPSQKRTSDKRHESKVSPRVPPAQFSPTCAVRTENKQFKFSS